MSASNQVRKKCHAIFPLLVPVSKDLLLWLEVNSKNSFHNNCTHTVWYFGVQPISHKSNRLLILIHTIKTTNWYRWEEIRYECNLWTNISPIRIDSFFSRSTHIVWCVTGDDVEKLSTYFQRSFYLSWPIGDSRRAEVTSKFVLSVCRNYIYIYVYIAAAVRTLRFVCWAALKCQAHTISFRQSEYPKHIYHVGKIKQTNTLLLSSMSSVDLLVMRYLLHILRC